MYDFGARNYDPALGRWFNIDPLAEKYYVMSPYTGIGNNPINIIDPDGRYLFGLFGSNAKQRRMARAERFAKKTGGTVSIGKNGRPTVNYITKEDDDYVINSTSKFGDFSSWSNFKGTLKGLDEALEGSNDKANYGGHYGGTDGMRAFGEDTGEVGDNVKNAGVVVIGASVATAQPEGVAVGEGIYTVGDGLGLLSSGILTYVDFAEGKNDDAFSRIVIEGFNALIGKSIDEVPVDDASKIIINETVNKALEEDEEK